MLLCSLFVYLFYRTEKTVITALCARVWGSAFEAARKTFQAKLPLPEFVVYNLPEMLWVATFTLLAGRLYIRFRGLKMFCFWLPLFAAAGLELLQILPSFPGRFDWMDLGGSIVAWAIAAGIPFHKGKRPQNLFRPFNRRSFAFAACYVLMYLAHVWR